MHYDEATYGDRIAAIYDELYESYDAAAIQLLVELAQGGRALELGIGTGRVALPLRRAGVDVHGIDASEAMVARLKAKPGGDVVPVTVGSFADLPVEGPFSLVYVVFNTFFALLTQAEQVQCFQRVAQRLTEEGLFVLEVFAPDMTRFVDRQAVRAVDVDVDQVRLDVSQLDLVNQRVLTQHVHLTEAGVRLFPVQLRFVWPSEMDLMAQLAGLTLRHRWSSWQREPFSNESGKHISVYARR